MSDFFENEDDKQKTSKIKNALKLAMISMLKKQSFGKISVKSLCKEIIISRSTFYVYFKDKYDLLKYCMNDLKKTYLIYAKNHSDKEIITIINDYIYENSIIIKNIIDDNNAEVIYLLLDLLTPDFSNILSLKEKTDKELSLSHNVLSHFYSGGIINLIFWQIKNEFPINKKLMSNYLYKILKGIEYLDIQDV